MARSARESDSARMAEGRSGCAWLPKSPAESSSILSFTAEVWSSSRSGSEANFASNEEASCDA